MSTDPLSFGPRCLKISVKGDDVTPVIVAEECALPPTEQCPQCPVLTCPEHLDAHIEVFHAEGVS